ncbi:MAG: Cna B-type domain-containing protein [Ruminococcaceae bacterium]|nr:Cna B-type domain-containing protein [Oscillospiraceae bacterium]
MSRYFNTKDFDTKLDKNISSRAAGYGKTRKKKKRLRTVVTYLAAIVVFCTVYALILPAITKERGAFCGFEEHLHSEECYSVSVPVCEICGEPVYEVIAEDTETPTTEASNSETDAAADEIEDSIDQDDTAESTEALTDETEKTAETAPDHVHKAPEGFVEKVLICEKSEHTHSDICYSDKESDVEDETVWEKTVPEDIPYDWQKALVEVAKSQLGYKESINNFIIDENGERKGYTRYGAWYGEPYGSFEETFVMFCMHYAGFDDSYLPVSKDVSEWINLLSEKELLKEPLNHMALPGDVVFIEDEEAVTHPAIICEITNDGENGPILKFIYADKEAGCISYGETEKDSPLIKGYADVGTAYKEYRKFVPFEKIYVDENVTVKATYYATAGIPEDAELTVTPVTEEKNSEYEDCYTSAIEVIESNKLQAVTPKVTNFRLYDISFLYDGKEVTTTDKVDVEISFPSEELNTENNVSVVHYAEEGAELSNVTDYYVDSEGNLNTSFETESFSLFAIVTVENVANHIINLSTYEVTSSNISSLGGKTFAIAADGHALYMDSQGTLSVHELFIRDSGGVTGEELLVKWGFERQGTTGSNYRLTATVEGNKYYIATADGVLSTVSDQTAAAVFTAATSGTGLTLKNGSSFIHLETAAPSMGDSQVLNLYTVPTGTYSVTFDGQIGLPTYMGSSNKKYTGAVKVTAQTDSEGYVTLPNVGDVVNGTTFTVPGNYPMKLNGWYDIINSVYYDSSMLGQKIKVTGDTTFYPEWVAETYDIGQNESVVTGQPDTRDFITTKVFDYNEIFNVQSATYNESDGLWYFDPDSELGFIFFDYINPSGNIGNIKSKDSSVDGITVNAEKTAGTRGSGTTFPGTITAGIANDKRIEALFGDDFVPGRLALGEADWLYSFDPDTGFYYYNSACNAASYNQSDQRFYVYDYVVNIDSQNSLNDFLPFNYPSEHNGGDKVFAEKDNEANYWFGMSSEIQFYLPEDSGSGYNFSANGEEMQFRFSGDDDVWVFIDGELVLDLGGVHDVVYGEINFSTGIVKTGQAFASNQVANNTADSYEGMPGVDAGTPAGVTITNLPTLEGGKEHTLTVYYLERGSSLSNCAIYFNLSPAYELEITKSDKNGSIYLANAQFQIFDDPECTIPSTLYIHNESGSLEEITGATFTTNEHGVLYCFGMLAGKKYYIKEVMPPSGYPDMSRFVIEVDLNEQGKPTQVVIDSNKDPWIYADAYVVSSDAQHRIELHVYNDTHIGGKETKKVYVEKTWGEGSTNLPESISVMLYSNGEPTSRTLTLNSENDWKGLFYELPVVDGYGNEIVYTVKENGIPYGYSVTYGEIIGEDSTTTEVPGYFEQATAFENGYIYHLVLPSTGRAIQGSSGTTISGAVSDNTNEAQLWKAISSGSGFLLQNVAYPSRYLNIGTSTSSITGGTSTTSNNAIITLTNEHLRSAAGGYLRAGTSSSSFRGTRYSSYAATITAYKWNPPSTTTTTVEVPGWRITNTPWDRLDIPIEKIWDETVSEANKAPIEFELYLVRNGEVNTPERVASLTLTAENSWSGVFEDLDYPGENGYYCIVEKTENYTVTYGGETVYILIDDTMCEAAVVNINSFGEAETVQTTNSVLYLLPDTGGIGELIVLSLGLIMIIPSGILLAYRYRKKRKEDFSP